MSASAAHAELVDDADRVAKMWSGPDVKVERLPPVFLEHGGVKALAIEPGLSGASDPAACTSVVLLGARPVDFVVATGGAMPKEDDDGLVARDDGRLRSVAGAVTIVRCGAERRDLARLAVEMISARGALEVLVARGPRARELKEILPERANGPTAPLGDPGRPLEPGPLHERLARAEQRAKLDGAARVGHAQMRASEAGTGELVLKLVPGCHRLEVVAEVPTTLPRRATDLDAELRDADTGKVLARDRADAADARIEACFGSARVVSLEYAGAAGPVRVTVSDAVWPIPEHIPSGFGPRARAGLASALRRRRVPAPADAPVFQTLGVQGTTLVPVEVVPGTCYVAAVGLLRGEARGIRLTAEVGDRAPRDEVVDHPEGSSIAFCADRSANALIQVETRGNTPWWVLALWSMGPPADGGNR